MRKEEKTDVSSFEFAYLRKMEVGLWIIREDKKKW